MPIPDVQTYESMHYMLPVRGGNGTYVKYADYASVKAERDTAANNCVRNIEFCLKVTAERDALRAELTELRATLSSEEKDELAVDTDLRSKCEALKAALKDIDEITRLGYESAAWAKVRIVISKVFKKLEES